MLRGEGWSLSRRDVAIFAVLGVANNALYLGLGYTGLQTVSAGLGGLIVSANPVFTAVLAAVFLGESLTWRKVVGAAARHRRRRLHRLASHVGRHRQPARHHVHAGVAGLDRGRHHPVQGVGAEGQPLARQRRANLPAVSRCCRSHRRCPASATSCRAGVCWAPLPTSCCAARSSPMCCGFICSRFAARPRQAPIIS